MPLFDQASLARQAMLNQLAPDGASADAAVPVSHPAGIGIAPYAALAGGSAADLGTTLSALRRPGTYEANPLLRGGTAEMIAVKGGTTAAILWAMRQLEKGGHPTIAKALGYGGGAVLGGVAAHNLGQGK